jgi:hypothetical protein
MKILNSFVSESQPNETLISSILLKKKNPSAITCGPHMIPSHQRELSKQEIVSLLKNLQAKPLQYPQPAHYPSSTSQTTRRSTTSRIVSSKSTVSALAIHQFASWKFGYSPGQSKKFFIGTPAVTHDMPPRTTCLTAGRML